MCSFVFSLSNTSFTSPSHTCLIKFNKWFFNFLLSKDNLSINKHNIIADLISFYL